MDTYITSAPDLEQAGIPLESAVRLPGERGTLPHAEPGDDIADDVHSQPNPPSAGEQHSTPAAVAVVEPRRRRWLLGTAAALVVLAGTGDAVWVHRQDIMSLPWPAPVTALLRAGEARMPAQLASDTGASEAGAAQPSAAPPAPARAAAEPPRQMSTAAMEFASLKAQDGPAEVGAGASPQNVAKPDEGSPASNSAASSPAPAETGVAAVPAEPLHSGPPAAATPASTASPSAAPSAPAVPPLSVAPSVPVGPPSVTTVASPATPPVTAVAPPAPTPPMAPRDAVEAATELQAAPLAPKQQVEVVGFVRELGAQLKETRMVVTQLKDTVADLKEEIEARTADFENRLSFAEAGNALAASARAGEAAQPPAVPASPAPPVAHLLASARAIPATSPPAAPVSRTAKDFRIQGASPGLAVLNALNPAGSETTVLYLALGDQVPGLGRVKAIFQRGTSWVVQTDNGLIQ